MERQIIIETIYRILEENDIVSRGSIVSDNVPLYEECDLTSLGVIDLIVSIEEQYEFEFTSEDLRLNNFETINKIADLIYEKLNLK